MTRFLTMRLKLKVIEPTREVARPRERMFLGFRFTNHPIPKLRIVPKALERFKEKIWELMSRTRGISWEQLVTSLSRYLHDPSGYFGNCQTPSVLRDSDSWGHRSLSAFL